MPGERAMGGDGSGVLGCLLRGAGVGVSLRDTKVSLTLSGNGGLTWGVSRGPAVLEFASLC